MAAVPLRCAPGVPGVAAGGERGKETGWTSVRAAGGIVNTECQQRRQAASSRQAEAERRHSRRLLTGRGGLAGEALLHPAAVAGGLECRLVALAGRRVVQRGVGQVVGDALEALRMLRGAVERGGRGVDGGLASEAAAAAAGAGPPQQETASSSSNKQQAVERQRALVIWLVDTSPLSLSSPSRPSVAASEGASMPSSSACRGGGAAGRSVWAAS